jgi:UDP-N-acetylmuramate--alanine ligase
MKIHFIGIGGIGISALAQYCLKMGHSVSGSDLKCSEMTEKLKKLGIRVFEGHKPSNVPFDADLVLITPAVDEKNPEYLEARKRKIKIQTWEHALGEISKKHFTICVSGSHGKTTTTALIALILQKAGLDPTVIVGTRLKEFKDSNFRFGKSRYLVIEADEYKKSFLHYYPKAVILTSLEYEHPDYFKNFQQYLEAFKEYLKILNDGILVFNHDDSEVFRLQEQFPKVKALGYSLKQKEALKLKKILKIPGKHNVSNALAALTMARILKIPDSVSFKAISSYKGAWRRFEVFNIKMNRKNVFLVSDYGHHPTQVNATISAAREKFLKKKIWVAFQAHQYLRTYYLFDDYLKAFDLADEIILPEIYAVAGRENKEVMRKLSSRHLVEALKKRFEKNKKDAKVHFLKDFNDIPEFLKNRIQNGDVLILMGAGDIYNLTASLTASKRKKKIK